MSRPYLAFSPPRPAPGGPGCKVGRGLWCVSPGTVPRSDEAEAEGKEESGPHPGHLTSAVGGGKREEKFWKDQASGWSGISLMQLHGLKQAQILVPNRGLPTCLASPTLYKPALGDKSLNVHLLWPCSSDGV